ncbi:MAG TPA: hypothetical protein VJS43_05045 [Candidatus Acidoferrales bacterium]|nr:hypothetical protein [Candidatus Acidoferrales bacterium]
MIFITMRLGRSPSSSTKNTLFRPEIKPARRKRYDRLMAQQQALKMDVRGALKSPLVPIVVAQRRDFPEPLKKIVQRTWFVLIRDNGGIRML